MEKGKDSSLFVNDGSFMERFKQLQQEKEKDKGCQHQESRSGANVSGLSTPKVIISKTNVAIKANDSRKSTPAPSSGKLAFSLKQKSKLMAPPVKLGEDEDEDEAQNETMSGNGTMKRQKLGGPDASEQASRQSEFVSSSPSDPTSVKKVADKLASYVAKYGREFEDTTRRRNPRDPLFKFLFDKSCSDYKYYEYRLSEEEKTLSKTKELQGPLGGSAADNNTCSSQRTIQKAPSYQTPASASYETMENPRASGPSFQTTSVGRSGEPSGVQSADSLAQMEYFMKMAAQNEKLRPPKASKDEMPPPASLQASQKRGHHMGDYIPPEELEKFMSNCNDAAAQKAAREAAERNKIQAGSVGHRLLSKMGWKEGEGLGSSRSGIADPILAGNVKKDTLGVGAQQPGEVTPEDDIYEQYKKRMMLGYRYRPNPLNNPRKAYY